MAFLKPDGSPFDFNFEGYIGTGTTGLVLRQGAYARKIPKVRNTSKLSGQEREDQEYINDTNCEALEHEAAIYRRVGKCRGIAQCIDLSKEGIVLEYLSRGDLETYLETEPEPEQSLKVQWILSVVETVSHFHQSRVLIDDIALRNLLIADDMSVKMIDFGQCSIFPEDEDISTADENGMTVQADIFHLGCVIYSIAAWKKFECNLFDYDYLRPPLQEMPALEHLLCGEMIGNCWTGQYQSTEDFRGQTDKLQGLSSSLTQK
ncbi:MAG: hypothetical protein M1837_006838 [Sclerophora amabilis]|nr:MAG: hypothetical protein M1837_006838 [Sclerophora amabilis]